MAKSEVAAKLRNHCSIVAVISVVIVAVAAFTSRLQHDSSHLSQEEGGIVEDCSCDYETVNRLNEQVLHPLLHELVKTPYYRFFKVKLWCNCPFWPDDGICRVRDCTVCECPENELHGKVRKPSGRGLSAADIICEEGNTYASVHRLLDTGAFKHWIEKDNPWTSDDESEDEEMVYLDLQQNPEHHTRYTGQSAQRIWNAIYTENNLTDIGLKLGTWFINLTDRKGESFQERNLIYKLISGLHSSISAHIAAEYLFDKEANLWGQNLTVLHERVTSYPDRVSNLYFTFLFVVQSVRKATYYLEHADHNTGNLDEDMKTNSILRELLYHDELKQAKLREGLTRSQAEEGVKQQFRNISALMDCVGCERCRLWGKLQFLGLATALKILFAVDDQDHLGETVEMQRSEEVSLINLLHQLSESVKFVHEMGPVANAVKLIESCPSQKLGIWGRIQAFLPKPRLVNLMLKWAHYLHKAKF